MQTEHTSGGVQLNGQEILNGSETPALVSPLTKDMLMMMRDKAITLQALILWNSVLVLLASSQLKVKVFPFLLRFPILVLVPHSGLAMP